MADPTKATDGPSVFDAKAYDYKNLPDWDNDFYSEDDILAFASELSAPEVFTSPNDEDHIAQHRKSNAEFITALNDWRPVRQRILRKRGAHRSKKAEGGRKGVRGTDETREGWTYSIVKYPLLFFVCGWIILLGFFYLLTRFYIWLYEQYVTWRGKRDRLRKNLRAQENYEDWVRAAQDLDRHLGNDLWKKDAQGSYYDWRMIKRIGRQLELLRRRAEKEERDPGLHTSQGGERAVDELRAIIETCVKFNFAGAENPRLYSETYFGTKDLLQAYVDETVKALKFLFASDQLTDVDKRNLAQHLSTNYGRTALCLSGGATFAYYHFGIAKALLDADLLPTIITGTSGGALIAALLATRTDEELKRLLVPALAYRITACNEAFGVWSKRWWKTGARFDSVDWAKRCAWFTRGSLTFLEAYQLTGRVLNVSCVPSDPHSPTILANYLTAPDCVVWSAVLASAAVPGILNPVVLMRKNRDGRLEAYNFGHKWKDGSLRTDIPLKSLNLHFNVNFSLVSQVNPHVSLWFFSSRGTVGRPVTHRRGRGWRGGYIGSAIEQFIKLDLNKWLKVLRHLELLPRPLGQDWSEVFLQRFSGTITIWPKTKISDFYHILSDPSMARLAGMIRAGQLAAWPKLKFLGNRMAIEKVIEEARAATAASTAVRPLDQDLPTTPFETSPSSQRLVRTMLSEEDLKDLLAEARGKQGLVEVSQRLRAGPRAPAPLTALSAGGRDGDDDDDDDEAETTGRSGGGDARSGANSPSLSKRVSGWFGALQSRAGSRSRSRGSTTTVRRLRGDDDHHHHHNNNNNPYHQGSRNGTPPGVVADASTDPRRQSSVMDELVRQSRVFFDDFADESVQNSEVEDEFKVGNGTGTETEDESAVSDSAEP